jgi:hypothetical protein
MAELSAEVIDFLSAGTRTTMLGYLATDGRPLVAPVWFIVDNGDLVFNTGRQSAKGRAPVRDSRVVSCVDDPHPLYSFVAGCRAAKKEASMPPGSVGAISAPTAPTNSASATPCPAS